MKHDYTFRLGRVTLLPLEEEDIEALRVLRNRERQYFLHTDEIPAEAQQKWYASYLKKEDDIMFKVVKTENTAEFIGAIAVYDIDREKGVAEFGRIVIDKNKAPEKGIGTDATKAVCLFAFDVLKLKKIVGIVLKTNERILKVDSRVGFRVVGDASDEAYEIELTRDSLNIE